MKSESIRLLTPIELNKPSHRIQSMDFVKFLAIFLVLWGHSIQYLSDGDYWDKPVYRFIYSFHMPLFMMVVGFFAANLYKSSFREMFVKKFRQLILPSITFGAILMVQDKFIYPGEGRYSNAFLYSIWFLKSAFACALLYWIATSNKKFYWFGIVTSLIFALFWEPMAGTFNANILQFIPDTKLANMYPCFAAGVLLKRFYSSFKEKQSTIVLISIIVFLGLYVFWDSSFFTVKPAIPSLEWHYWYRLAIGIFGSMAVIAIAELVADYYKDKNSKWFNSMCKWGSATLGIYCVQTFLLEKYLPKLVHFDGMNFYIFNFIICPLISVVIIFLSLYIVKMFESNSYAAYMFLGKARKKKCVAD